jgi:hypothetical protein
MGDCFLEPEFLILEIHGIKELDRGELGCFCCGRSRSTKWPYDNKPRLSQGIPSPNLNADARVRGTCAIAYRCIVEANPRYAAGTYIEDDSVQMDIHINT